MQLATIYKAHEVINAKPTQMLKILAGTRLIGGHYCVGWETRKNQKLILRTGSLPEKTEYGVQLSITVRNILFNHQFSFQMITSRVTA